MEDARLIEYMPTGQLTQLVEPALSWYWPATQRKQADTAFAPVVVP